MASRNRKFRCVRNEGFVCGHCGVAVLPLARGSSRNHCPRCLWSKHVDLVPGDRLADCAGMMKPIAVQVDPRRGWMIVHQCLRCGVIHRNKAALNDPAQPDDFQIILDVAR